LYQVGFWFASEGFDEVVKLFEMENIAGFDEDLERGRQIAEDFGY
jgi:hypothetical protein